MDRGDVRLVAGRVESARAEDEVVKLVVRRAGLRSAARVRDTSWVINCTGPVPSNSVESNPVIGSLLVSGVLRPDELSLGIDTTPDGNAIAADGREVARPVPGRHAAQVHGLGEHRGPGIAQPGRGRRRGASSVCWRDACSQPA